MDIESWLRGLGLEKYAPAFRENEIDAAMLPKLTADDLKELGVSALGHRKKLMEAIAALAGPSPQAAPPPAEGPGPERRRLTVMFVDLVGSTQMAGRLDPEDMRNVILDYQQRVAAEIQKVGGNVAKYMGDGVLAYFGWPRAHENEAERAVRAGLAISASVATQKSPLPEPLSARIGIATGLVVVGNLIAEMLHFTTEHRLELWRGYAEQFLAITQLTGNTDLALATLEQARAGLKARNAGLFSSTLAVEAAKRLLASARPAEAGNLLDEAEALIGATGERFAEPEYHRIRGRYCKALESGSNQSRQHLERAVALAEERGALHWLELARRDLRQT